MKVLKLMLGDEKVYSFTTFSMRQRIAIKEVYNKATKMQEEQDEIQFEKDDDGKYKKDKEDYRIPRELSNEDRDKIIDITQRMSKVLVDIYIKSITRKTNTYKRYGIAGGVVEALSNGCGDEVGSRGYLSLVTAVVGKECG